VALELVVLAAGLAIYMRVTRAKGVRWAAAFAVFALVLTAIAVATPFMPDPPSDRTFAVQALALYGILAAFAGVIDRGRVPRDAP
jgi:uncharacterized membrane protein